MPQRTASVDVAFSAQQMYDLVVDMERYPEFIPWVVKARKYDEKGSHFMSEMTFAFKGFREIFHTKDAVEVGRKITIAHVSGPFKHLNSEWAFTDLPSGGSRVDFFIDFKFKQALVDVVLGPVFGKASQAMVAAFCKRASEIYES